MAATVIPRTEKDFYLQALFQQRIPLRFRFNRQEYLLMAARDPTMRLCFQADRPVPGLWPGRRMELLFEFFGKCFQFTVEAAAVRGKIIVAAGEPDLLRKDLERSFVRIAPAEDLRAAFVFQEERYALKFPRVGSYEPVRLPPLMEEGGQRSLKAVMEDLNVWAAGAADGVKVALFNSAKARQLEERLVARTGLGLYIPSPEEGFAKEDAKGGLLTGRQFLRGFERMGYEREAAAALLEGMMKGKEERGIHSEVWAPIRFQEYVLGCVYVWTLRRGKPPLDYQAVETIGEFTKGIAWAFKSGGSLESRRMRRDAFEGRVVDISASGLRFCYPPGKPGLLLPPGVELGVTLETPGRRVRARVEMVRRVPGRVEMGGRFVALAAEDQRRLFEYLYGEPFSAGGKPFLAGQV